MNFENIRKTIDRMVEDKIISEQEADIVARMVSDYYEAWRSEREAKVKKMIKEWELIMSEDDKSLYSLGLRRALDIFMDDPRSAYYDIENHK